MISSRTPEGPLNFCRVCGTHCRIEPALLTRDAVCPRCGSLLWFALSGQKLAVNSLESKRIHINHLAKEIAELSRMDLAPAEFYGQFLPRVLAALAAPAGAVWLRTKHGNLEIKYQVNMRQLAKDFAEGRQIHDELIRQAVMKGQPGIVLPKSLVPEYGIAAGNPTDYVILLAPILCDKQAAGLLEVWQDPNRGNDVQRGFLQFMMRMASLASGYVHKTMAAES